MPDAIPRVGAIALDLRAFGAAVVIALLTTLLSAIVPALQASRPDLTGVLRDGGRAASAGAGRQRARSILVVLEVALAVILVTGAALFAESFRRLMRVDLGYDTSNVLTVSVSPRFAPVAPGAPQPDASAQLESLVERLARVPGVTRASAIAGGTPLTMSRSTSSVIVRGATFEREDSVSIRRVTAAYHETMRIPLIEGRLLSIDDRKGSMPVAVVNELAVRAYFDGRSPIGESAIVNGVVRTIVGVVGNVHQNDHEIAPLPEFYVPMSQARTTSADILLRTAGDPYSVLAAVRTAALDVIRDVPLRNPRSLDDALARRVAQRRLNMLLVGLFGILALVISAAGIYGSMAFMVAQRRREIGVRMALGATRRQVVGAVMARAATLTVAGLAAGLAGAWLLSNTARAFLFEVSATDPRAFGAAVVLLAAAALVASLAPAGRAASIDPAIALRAD
jgi:putative ABC transport system permease protein